MNESKMAAKTYYVDGVENPTGWIQQTLLERRGILGGRSGVVLNAGVSERSGFVHNATVLDTWHGIPVPLFEMRRKRAVRRAENVVRRAAGK